MLLLSTVVLIFVGNVCDLQRNNVTLKSALVLDSFEYFLVCLLKYPTTSHSVLSAEGGGVAGRFSPVDLLLTRGVGSWSRGVPYLALLQEYLKEFLPLQNSGNTSAGAALAGIAGTTEGGATGAATDIAGSGGGPLEQDALRLRYSELFVQLAAAYWIDVALLVKCEHDRVNVLRKLLNNPNASTFGGELGVYCVRYFHG